jgi:hypothetical protein
VSDVGDAGSFPRLVAVQVCCVDQSVIEDRGKWHRNFLVFCLVDSKAVIKHLEQPITGAGDRSEYSRMPATTAQPR